MLIQGVLLFLLAAARPAPQVGLTIEAPAPNGLWTMRVVNQGDRVVRIPADARLLHLKVTPPGGARGGRPVTCAIPRPLRPVGFPEDRALYLGPGQAYVESFDPWLYCFGPRETNALVPGAEVRASFGWPETPAGRRHGPYAVEGIAWPPEQASMRELEAPPVEVGPCLESCQRPEGVAPFDERAPRLEIEAQRFLEAWSRRGMVVRAAAKNAGRRPMHVVLRDRMLRFEVSGPDGRRRCALPESQRDATPRQLFRTIAPGGSVSLASRIIEVCGHDAFVRPGLYVVTTTLEADETEQARGFEGFTGTARSPQTTLVRLLSAPQPFHEVPPHAEPSGRPRS